ncbi:MAG: hypothetical protein QW744_04405 [Candidatus Bathyarchaeia archaeon]
MIGQKMTMAAAAVLAVALAFLLVGMSYILFPEQTSQEQTPMPIPKPQPLLDQILWAIQWIGLAAFIAITVVGAVLLMNRIRSKKTPKSA